jgi:hypothetical protein
VKAAEGKQKKSTGSKGKEEGKQSAKNHTDVAAPTRRFTTKKHNMS